MALPISICKVDAQNAPDALKHVPDLGPRGREIRFRDQGPENRVWVLRNNVHHLYIHKGTGVWDRKIRFKILQYELGLWYV